MFTTCCHRADDTLARDGYGDQISKLQPSQDETAEQLGLSLVEEEFREDDTRDAESRQLTLERSAGVDWGFTVTSWSNFLQVNEIEGSGAIETYNAGRPARLQLRVDDAVLSVNGRIPPKWKWHDILTDTRVHELELQVVRLLKRSICIARSDGASWGVNVDKQECGKGLLVKSFVPGKPAELHNERSAESRAKVLAGDIVVAANGHTGMDTIIEAFRDPSVRDLKLLILRLPSREVGGS